MKEDKLYDIASLEKVVFGVISPEEKVKIESERRRKELLDAFIAQHNCKPDEVVLVDIPLAMNDLRGYPQGYFYVRTKAHYNKVIQKLKSIKEIRTTDGGYLGSAVLNEIDCIISMIEKL